MKHLPYIIIFTLTMGVLIYIASYSYKNRHRLDEMHGMMVGMTLGMVAGLVSATLYLIPTGDFLSGVIIGSLIGLLFGILLGKLGGHLGIMEGIIAGPMGGMMGAMLGQMVRPFSIEIFIPFLMFIFLLSMMGITYAVHCKCNGEHCEPGETVSKVSDKFLLTWILTVSFLLVLSIFLPFSIPGQDDSNAFTGVSGQGRQPNGNKDTIKEVVVKNGVQTIDLEVNSAGSYSPSTIIAKEGKPLKIKFSTKVNTCAKEIIFPDLGIDVIAPDNGTKTIEIKQPKKGTYFFRCPMDMNRGKLIIK